MAVPPPVLLATGKLLVLHALGDVLKFKLGEISGNWKSL